MAKMDDFSVGDKLVDYGEVYEITKIVERENGKGKEEVIFYKPAFPTKKNETVMRSIPVNNLDKTEKRLLISEDKAEEILDYLAEEPKSKKRVHLRSAKKHVHKNDIDKIAEILKRLAREKKDEDINFTYTRKRVFRQAKKRLTEEIAMVYDETPRKVRSKIQAALKKSTANMA